MLNNKKFLNFLSIFMILLLGAFLRIKNLTIPYEIYFDETYYIKAAKEYLKFLPDSNWAHPPLAKIFMSWGIFMFGDNPVGWRIIGVILGILMILIIYLFAGKLFKNKFAANCAAFLLAICPVNIVMSKIALLDIYLSFFCLVGFYFLYLYLDSQNKTKTYLILSILCFAASFSCKWSGIFAIIGAVIILAYYKYKERKIKENFAVILFLFLSLTMIIYLAAYFPFFTHGGNFSKFIANHISSVKFHYEISFKHAYLSPVWTWPLLIRPIWFYFKEFTPQKFIGIICMGNPFIWWTFFPIFAYLIFDFLKNRKVELFFIIFGYLSLYAFWFISIKGGFFYYMLSATIFMYLATTYVLNKLWINDYKYEALLYLFFSFIFFIIFSPIILAFPINKSYFYKIMWLKSWI